MPSTLTFLGAAHNVTGSRYLLQTDRAKILVDAGLFQERENLGLNWDNFGLYPRDLDAVLLTHGHMDHCGWLPKLVKDGFKGEIFCTPATADLVPIILRDIARIQEEDALTKAKRHRREDRTGPEPKPLYDSDDVDKTLARLRRVEYGQAANPVPGLTATWRVNGHILGAAWIDIEAEGRRIAFSGDVGRWDRPILKDPEPPRTADYLVIESTYGDRDHSGGDTETQLAEVLAEASRRGGNLLIPSFSVERAQELLYALSKLGRAGKLPQHSVYLDSPMASKVTGLFKLHPEDCDEEMLKLMADGQSPFGFAKLHYTGSAEESKKINAIRSGAVIIAGNGMCTGGRIKHHLSINIEHPGTTVLFAGFQAPGTLGRELLDGAKEIRLFNRIHQVKAAVRQLSNLSGHADRSELSRWAGEIKGVKRCFVTHGETKAAEALAGMLREKHGWDTHAPLLRERVEL